MKDDILEFLTELNLENDTLLFDNPDYNTAFIGVDGGSGRAIYDYREILIVTEGMEEDEAHDFIGYNTIRSLGYQENPPITMTRIGE